MQSGILGFFPESTGIADVWQWKDLFLGKAKFCVFCHQQWVAWVKEQDGVGAWSGWLEYVEARYGYGA
jgi:hypothetical protein